MNRAASLSVFLGGFILALAEATMLGGVFAGKTEKEINANDIRYVAKIDSVGNSYVLNTEQRDTFNLNGFEDGFAVLYKWPSYIGNKKRWEDREVAAIPVYVPVPAGSLKEGLSVTFAEAQHARAKAVEDALTSDQIQSVFKKYPHGRWLLNVDGPGTPKNTSY